MSGSLFYKCIFDQPAVWTDIIENRDEITADFKSSFEGFAPDRIICVGSGSSHYATVMARDVLKRVFKCEVVCEVPSKFNMDNYPGVKNPIIFTISQSGMSTNTYEIIEDLNKRGYKTVTLTENLESPVAKISTMAAALRIGEEPVGPKTKGMTATALTLILMALSICDDEEYIKSVLDGLNKLAATIGDNLKKADAWIDGKLAKANEFGHFYCIEADAEGAGKETCLKIIETSYMPVSYFTMDEYFHGVQLAIDKNAFLILMVPPKGFDRERMIKLDAFVKKNNGTTFILDSGEGDFDDALELKGESIPELINFVYLPAAQLFAAKLCDYKGFEPDNSRYPDFYAYMGNKMG